MIRIVKTQEEIEKRLKADPKTTWSISLEEFRSKFYEGAIAMVSKPTIIWDPKTDRYALKFTINGVSQTLKTTNAVAAAVARLSSEKNVYFGFFVNDDGVIVGFNAEVW